MQVRIPSLNATAGTAMYVMKNKTQVRQQDIAGALNLSTATVSRALAGSLDINEETRHAVQRAAMAMGYQARQPGRRRPRSSTRTVGVLVSVHELHNRCLTLLLEEIHHSMLDWGYHIMVVVDPMNSRHEAAYLSKFRPMLDGYLEGMILCSATADSLIVQELLRLGVPTVMVLRSVADLHIDTVEPDNFRGGAELMRHLYELGHRHIGLVMGPQNASTSWERAAGALDFLRRVGVPLEDTPLSWNEFTFDAGYTSALKLLRAERRVTAIMGGSDSIAMGVLEAARCLEITVPDQLSVAGFDDLPLSGSRLISLTTIHNPVRDMARAACRRMVGRIRTGHLTQTTRDLMPVQLVRRGSTAVPSGD